MGSFSQICRYCQRLIPGDADFCPHCQRINPLAARCPRCRAPIRTSYKSCASCGLELEIQCPRCGRTTFFDDYCQHCSARLTVECPNPKCRLTQASTNEKCCGCGQPLPKTNKER